LNLKNYHVKEPIVRFPTLDYLEVKINSKMLEKNENLDSKIFFIPNPLYSDMVEKQLLSELVSMWKELKINLNKAGYFEKYMLKYALYVRPYEKHLSNIVKL
jgi:uncharacterized membrane protein YoaT (DUF817 family)